jgi:hypothetical protein
MHDIKHLKKIFAVFDLKKKKKKKLSINSIITGLMSHMQFNKIKK